LIDAQALREIVRKLFFDIAWRRDDDRLAVAASGCLEKILKFNGPSVCRAAWTALQIEADDENEDPEVSLDGPTGYWEVLSALLEFSTVSKVMHDYNQSIGAPPLDALLG
jgi:hypothetical protein